MALELLAAVAGQKLALPRRLYPLGQYVQAQPVGQGDDGAGDRGVARVFQDVAHKSLVDLDLVQGQALEVAQRRVAGAEIIQCKTDTALLQHVHLGDHLVHLFQQQAFGQLQFQQPGRGARVGQGGEQPGDEVRVAELPGAHVHGHRQVGRGRVAGPGCQLLARAAQHPAPQGDDQPALLGQRDELRRPHQSALRVLPAHQRLGALGPILDVVLQLVVQAQLVALEPHPQMGLQRSTGRDGELHVGVEEAEGVAARALGLVHRQVGLFEQLLDRMLVAPEHDHTDAGRAVVLAVVDHVGLAHVGGDLLHHLAGPGGGLVHIATQLLQDHHKLVAAQACHGVAAPHAAHQPVGDLLQQQVAAVMAPGVVEVLEVVEVDEQQRAGLAMACAYHQGPLQPIHQQAAVGQAGQVVLEGQAVDLLLRPLVAGDVAADTVVTQKPPLCIEQRCAADRNPVHFAMPVDELHLEVMEHLVRLQRGLVRLPLRMADVESGQLPPAAAQQLTRRQADTGAGAGLDADQAELLVLLPVPVGRQLHQAALAGIGLECVAPLLAAAAAGTLHLGHQQGQVGLRPVPHHHTKHPRTQGVGGVRLLARLYTQDGTGVHRQQARHDLFGQQQPDQQHITCHGPASLQHLGAGRMGGDHHACRLQRSSHHLAAIGVTVNKQDRGGQGRGSARAQRK